MKNNNLIVGVVGAGAMGSGIAQIAATAGHKVLLYDQNVDAIDRSKNKLQKILNRLVEKGRIDNAKLKNILSNHLYIENFESLGECDLIIEAIVENLEIKQKVFRSLENITSKETWLATNTSSLPVTKIASVCEYPDRIFGLHFFNPAPLMKLVEVIPALQSDPAIPQRAYDLMESWGKIPVMVKDTPGFIVNRVARPFYSEALRIYDEGLADMATIDWAMTSIGGFRMGPFTLMDFIGHDVNYEVTHSMYMAYFQEPRYKPSFTQQRLVDAGFLGKKSGRGFYTYSDDMKLEPNKDEELGRRIVDRIVCMLINEATDAWYYKIADRDAIDAAMEKGVNYPKGLLRWADELGISNVCKQLNDLYEHYQEDRYRLSPGLRQKLQNGTSFY